MRKSEIQECDQIKNGPSLLVGLILTNQSGANFLSSLRETVDVNHIQLLAVLNTQTIVIDSVLLSQSCLHSHDCKPKAKKGLSCSLISTGSTFFVRTFVLLLFR